MKTKAHFYDIEEVVIEHIRKANKSIRIIVAWFTSEKILNELAAKASQGIQVEVIVSNSQVNFIDKGFFQKLILSCGNVRVGLASRRFIHHKFCIIDDAFLLNGSFNFTGSANKYNLENIVVFNFEGDKSELLKQFIKIFDKIKTRYSSVFIDDINTDVVKEDELSYNLPPI
jgi:phosphatidylserine/phosphatidylglycerophosphate/cardiolipin synthase-like enzyme